MPDDHRQESELNRFWNELVGSDAEPAAGELDASQAETLHRIHAMTQTPPPAGARAIDDGAVRLHVAARQNGRDTAKMSDTEALAFPRSGSALPAWFPPRQAARPAPTRWGWIPPFATALLLLVTVGLAYLVFGPNRPEPERPADQPAVVAPATASPSVTPDQMDVTLDLPAGALPDEVVVGFNYYTVAPGSAGTWDWTCCTGIRLDYVLEGALTITGAGPMQVLRANSTGGWEEVAAGTEIVLQTGDALYSRMEDTFDSVNAGSTQVELLDGVLFTGTPVDDPVPYTDGGVEAWTFHAQDLLFDPVAVAGEPVTVRIRRIDLAANEILPVPADGSTQLAVDLDENAVLTTEADFSRRNASEAPLTAYAMTLEAGEDSEETSVSGGRAAEIGSAAAAVATPGTPAAVDTVFSTTLPPAQIPTAGNLDFLFWRVSLEPHSRGPASAQSGSCCPGPQITHVLEGDLTLRVSGTARVYRGGDIASGGSEIPPDTDLVLRPGDTAVFDYATPAEYANQGSLPVQLVGGGIFAGAVRGGPMGAALLDHNESYSIPALPAGPLEATLTRATLPPGGEVPPPAAGALVLDVGAFGDADIAQRADAALRNIGVNEETIYVLTLTPLAAPDGVSDITPT